MTISCSPDRSQNALTILLLADGQLNVVEIPLIRAVMCALKALSPREMQIVRSTLKGRRNKEIGAELGISQHTVGSHLRRVYLKAGVRSKIEMAIAFLPLVSRRTT
ncbi:MAG TPA: helix-turn-helix transcriptional regulator [Terriglobia bacterium]|nr:helix-turn-helix transcriptional regulator [Terriglobia bacterium]